jgi:hypothetical protein
MSPTGDRDVGRAWRGPTKPATAATFQRLLFQLRHNTTSHSHSLLHGNIAGSTPHSASSRPIPPGHRALLAARCPPRSRPIDTSSWRVMSSSDGSTSPRRPRHGRARRGHSPALDRLSPHDEHSSLEQERDRASSDHLSSRRAQRSNLSPNHPRRLQVPIPLPPAPSRLTEDDLMSGTRRPPDHPELPPTNRIIRSDPTRHCPPNRGRSTG